ncbi:hypothetical protein [Rhodanobacter sp. L36]|uniref:hypothetical protein n=1 Tax=Rhodanobacter sp. L36 TaxID=1747221 RepID=UPI00131D4947|nr:hypothetical protein [Rhodanobacter sp. L36]
MANQFHVIEIHLWILTGLLVLILVSTNYTRIKNEAAVTPYQRAKDMWEREQFAELRDYTKSYLKERPNTDGVLMFDAMVAMHFKDYDRARWAVGKLSKSLNYHEMASKIIGLIDAEAAPVEPT